MAFIEDHPRNDRKYRDGKNPSPLKGFPIRPEEQDGPTQHQRSPHAHRVKIFASRMEVPEPVGGGEDRGEKHLDRGQKVEYCARPET